MPMFAESFHKLNRIIGFGLGVLFVLVFVLSYMVLEGLESLNSTTLSGFKEHSESSVRNFESQLVDQYRNQIRYLVESIMCEIVDLNNKVEMDSLSLDQAQAIAGRHIRKARYNEGKGYFWVNDDDPVHTKLIVHPILTGLEGTDISEYKKDTLKITTDNPTNMTFFRFVVHQCLKSPTGDSYVFYQMQDPLDITRWVPKMSYIKRFEPWGWIVGSGVDLNEIDTAINKERQRNEAMAEVFSSASTSILKQIIKTTTIAMAILVILVIAFFFYMSQIAKKARRDEYELKKARDELEIRVKERTAELSLANHELHEKHAQLVQSEKMASIGQLAAGVAHEINNPVGFVKSNLSTLDEYSQILKDVIREFMTLLENVKEGKNIDDEGVRSIVSRIDEIDSEEDLALILEDLDSLISESAEGTQRVKEIVQNLKSFARLDESEIKEADINEGIESTLKVVWNELKYKTEVVKSLNYVPVILCYAGQLNQVFMNLLLNAVQAIPEKGRITIETESDDRDITIRISDTGAGISQENQAKLFDPFFTTKEIGKGTGLGLAISYGIIQKHSGTIDVVSEVGKGSTFTIKLPIKGVGT